MDVLQVLKPRFHRLQLKGYRNGIFNEHQDKLFGYALLSVKDEEYESLNNWFLHDKGGYSFRSTDEEKHKIYNENGSYIYKGAEQLIREGIFNYVSLRFYGALYESEWYIMFQCSYHEGADEATIIKEIENDYAIREDLFSSSTYQPLPALREELDLEGLRRLASEKAGRELSLREYELVFDYTKEVPGEELPKKFAKQPVDQREFVGQPWIVAQVKQEQKSKINRAFEAYFNLSVLLPFLQKIRIQQFENFSETETLYHQNYYPLIYPHSKEYVLCVVKAINEKGKSRLYYFLYLASPKEIYQWIKPEVKEAPGHYAYWIQEDIKDLSVWGGEFDLHEPSVTMDDEMFWQEHVLKKENNKFLYLIPVYFS